MIHLVIDDRSPIISVLDISGWSATVSLGIILVPRVNSLPDMLAGIPLHAETSRATVEEMKLASEQQRPEGAVLRMTNFLEKATVREMQLKKPFLQAEFSWPHHYWYAAAMWPALIRIQADFTRTTLFVSKENVFAITPLNGNWVLQTLSKSQAFLPGTRMVSLLAD